MTSLLRGLLVTALLALPALAGATYQGKQETLIDASQQALDALIELRNSDQLNSDSALQVIQENLSAQFNFMLITRKALGKHWRKADDAQRVEVSELFQHLLEKTYAAALSKFTNQQIEYQPAEELKDGSVRLRLHITDAERVVEIEYLLKENDGVWEIDDVKIEKVSLLSNYRRQFNGVVRKSGIDGLIKLLRERL